MRPEDVTDWASLARFLSSQQASTDDVATFQPAFEGAPGTNLGDAARIQDNADRGFAPDAFDLQGQQMDREAEAIMARPTRTSPAQAAGYGPGGDFQRPMREPAMFEQPQGGTAQGPGEDPLLALRPDAPDPMGGIGAGPQMAQDDTQTEDLVNDFIQDTGPSVGPITVQSQAEAEGANARRVLAEAGMPVDEVTFGAPVDPADAIAEANRPTTDPAAVAGQAQQMMRSAGAGQGRAAGGHTPGPGSIVATGGQPGAAAGPGAPPVRPRPEGIATPAGIVPVQAGTNTTARYQVGGGGGGPVTTTTTESEVHPLANNPRDLRELNEAQADVRAQTDDTAQRMVQAERFQEEHLDAFGQERGDQAKQEQMDREAAMGEARQQLTQHRQLVEQVRGARVDTNRFFSTRNGPGMFGAAMALALADVTPGRGAAIIMDLVGREIQAQEQDLAHQRHGVQASENLLGAMRRIHGDEELARNATRDALIERYAIEAQSLAARNRGQILGQQAELAAAQLREQQAIQRLQIARDAITIRTSTRSRSGGGGQRPVDVSVNVPAESEARPGGQRIAASLTRDVSAYEEASRALYELAEDAERINPGFFGGELPGVGNATANQEEAQFSENFNATLADIARPEIGSQQTVAEIQRIIRGLPNMNSPLVRVRWSGAQVASRLRNRAARLAQRAQNLRADASMSADPTPSSEHLLETGEAAGAEDREQE